MSDLRRRAALHDIDRRCAQVRAQRTRARWLIFPLLILIIVAMVVGLVLGLGARGQVVLGFITATGAALSIALWERQLDALLTELEEEQRMMLRDYPLPQDGDEWPAGSEGEDPTES